MAPTYPILE